MSLRCLHGLAPFSSPPATHNGRKSAKRYTQYYIRVSIIVLCKKLFKNFLSEIESVVAFSYKPEGYNKYVYMITDPDCPFCEKSKEAVKQWADANKVEIKVIFFPLESLHPQAKDKAIKAVCSGMKYDDYLNSRWTGNKCSEGVKKIEDSIALMKKININGTPSFISFNGKRLMGFSPQELDNIIK